MDFRRTERAQLIADLVTLGDLTDPRVARAMERAPRHWFLPDPSEPLAYIDAPLSIGWGQTISQPAIVAQMTTALELNGGERVLEIGTGSGWQAAVLSSLCAEVYTVERIAALGRRARDTLSKHGFANVHVRIGDGFEGWREHAPFDRIILTAAPRETPRALYDQLAEGGILIAPVGEGEQVLVRDRKVGGAIQRDELAAVVFVPMLGGVAA